MSQPSTGTLRRMQAAHYSIVAALYGCRSAPLSGGQFVHTPHIEDPEWNHLGMVDAPEAAIEPLADAAVRECRRVGRRPTIAVDSLTRPTGLDVQLEQRGWQLSFRHVWLIHPDTSVAPGGAPEGVLIRAIESRLELGRFLDVFAAVFTPDDDHAAAGFRAALRDSASSRGPEVVHYLALCDGRPAGIASSVRVGGVAGGFNLGVLPAFRGRGIGRALTLTRIEDARRAGCDLVYLITEDPAVEAAQLRTGHVRVMVTQGWSPPT